MPEHRLNLDVWAHGGQDNPSTVLVPKAARSLLQDGLEAAGIGYTLAVENVKEELDLEEKLLSEAAAKSNRTSRFGLSFDTIHRYAAVDTYLVELANRYPNLVTVVSAGRSFEGRDIKYLRISTTNFQDRSKPIVYMQSLLHACEWVTLPATLYAIEKLVIDVQEQDLLHNYQLCLKILWFDNVRPSPWGIGEGYRRKR
ncbi:carboxypeptidase B-like [Cydia amplana]|uniref:carboxypeptidase B-like n=1 Tax=Cydia amplana TaxID=1869771 RepID=UPI002FE669FF